MLVCTLRAETQMKDVTFVHVGPAFGLLTCFFRVYGLIYLFMLGVITSDFSHNGARNEKVKPNCYVGYMKSTNYKISAKTSVCICVSWLRIRHRKAARYVPATIGRMINFLYWFFTLQLSMKVKDTCIKVSCMFHAHVVVSVCRAVLTLSAEKRTASSTVIGITSLIVETLSGASFGLTGWGEVKQNSHNYQTWQPIASHASSAQSAGRLFQELGGAKWTNFGQFSDGCYLCSGSNGTSMMRNKKKLLPNFVRLIS